ncbi:MAG TPA: hypothetical protein VFI70_08250, partial [Nitrososphaeraceae archaeon]|nr:hypothetical protein [Nitrososphaeraceae archaeon]
MTGGKDEWDSSLCGERGESIQGIGQKIIVVDILDRKKVGNMISDKDHFALLKTIKGIKDNVDKMYTLGNDELQYMRDEFLGYLKQLVDVVNG